MALTISITTPQSPIRKLNLSQVVLDRTLRRLSSGLRVNQAADDPGRVSSITLAESKTRGIQQSIRNLNSAASLTQTLEGGLNNIEQALQRIREISVQAASDHNSLADRQALQEEVTQITRMIDEIASGTEFNRISLLDGTSKGLRIFLDLEETILIEIMIRADNK